MAQITQQFAEEIYHSGMNGQRTQLTANEQAQLAWAWITLQIANGELKRLTGTEQPSWCQCDPDRWLDGGSKGLCGSCDADDECGDPCTKCGHWSACNPI